MPPQRARLSDSALLSLVGVLLFVVGLGLLIAALSEMVHLFPPTYGRALNILLGFGFGFALLITGFMYTFVARSGEEPEVGPEGLSITRDPQTGAREWIKLDVIVMATLRPWSMSPWIRQRKYFELELKVKEGDLTIDDRFYLHVGDEAESFTKRLGELLGERLSVATLA